MAEPRASVLLALVRMITMSATTNGRRIGSTACDSGRLGQDGPVGRGSVAAGAGRILVAVSANLVTACTNQACLVEGPTAAPTRDVYSVTVVASTVSNLPKCASTLPSTTA